MGKKFTEYSRFDLSEINKEVLNQWDKQDLFTKVWKRAKGVLHSYFTKVRLLPTVCRVFTM